MSLSIAYETKEEVMEWTLDIQLGRQNLSPIQRIAVAEKYRPIYEKQARENQLSGLKQNQNTVSQNSSKRTETIDIRETNILSICAVILVNKFEFIHITALWH